MRIFWYAFSVSVWPTSDLIICKTHVLMYHDLKKVLAVEYSRVPTDLQKKDLRERFCNISATSLKLSWGKSLRKNQHRVWSKQNKPQRDESEFIRLRYWFFSSICQSWPNLLPAFFFFNFSPGFVDSALEWFLGLRQLTRPGSTSIFILT